jgi:predicted O-linked N-acetylglucosamine transferase (SPINDLY family)
VLGDLLRSLLRPRKPGVADAAALNERGLALLAAGDAAGARAAFLRAAELAPAAPEPLINLGSLTSESEPAQSLQYYRRAAELAPREWMAVLGHALGLYRAGDDAEAKRLCRRAYELSGNDALRLTEATMLPPLPGSAEHILAARAEYEAGLDRLLEGSLSIDDPAREIATPGFFHLAYHAMDNRALQVKLAQVYAKACPGLRYVAPYADRPRAQGRVRVAFVSRYLRSHTIGRVFRGLIAKLDRQRFSVSVFFVGRAPDPMSDWIAAHADHAVDLPGDFRAARQAIAESRQDVLFYTDIGMESFTYFLAFSRLAPVQCVGWGHADTTGIDTLDYYVSHAECEPAEAAAHYSEKLAAIGPGTALAYYYRPEHEGLKSREQLGLPASASLYLCPQHLFKIHPEQDLLFREVLSRDPGARLLLIRDRADGLWRVLQRRLEGLMPGLMSRVVFLPPLSHRDYLSVAAAADVVLDTVHFGGGNSSFDCLAVGAPIVTLPGAFARSRYTLADYSRMGVGDCVARTPAQYVDIAVRLGTDRDANHDLRRRLAAAAPRLFEDDGYVRAVGEFLSTISGS